MDTGQILLYALAGLLLILWIRRRILIASIPQVNRAEAEERAHAGEAVLVDVRTAQERSRTTIKDSMHLPVSDMTDMEKALERYRDRQVIFFCATGSRSISAASRAKKLGFSVANLNGGIGW